MRRAAVALASLVLLAGCGSTPAPEATVSVVKTDKTVVVPATLTFTGKTLDGRAFDASTLAGKPAVLWFWAPWCATCASEAQSIGDLAEQYGDRLGILGIAGLGDNKAMHEFVADLEVGAVPHLDDQAGVLWKKFKIVQQSWYVFLDRDGTIVHTGYLDDQQLTAEVKSLVA